jgi:hypothetical protein
MGLSGAEIFSEVVNGGFRVEEKAILATDENG